MKTLYYAIRFLLRTKSYTIINLLGLAFSLACCIILLRYIHRELTVDTHCIDRNQVYGVQTTFEGNRVLSVAEIGSRDSVYIDNSGIGDGAATGGSDWKKYMHPKYQRRIFFPELWSAEELTHWGESEKM